MKHLTLSDTDADRLEILLDKLSSWDFDADEHRTIRALLDQLELADSIDVHNAGAKGPITTLYAFVSIAPDGGEGIAASILPHLGSTPLITSRASIAEKCKSLADQIHRDSSIVIELHTFVRQGEALWRTV